MSKFFTENDIRSVYRFKVTTNLHGSGLICIETFSVCCVKLSDALTCVSNSFSNVSSVEILERLNCVLL